MKTIAYAILALALWLALSIVITAGGTPMLKGGILPKSDAFIFAVPAVLLIGSVYYIPIVAYVVCADALARVLAYPANVAAYLALMALGALLLFGIRSMMPGHSIRTSFEDPEWIVIPTVVIATLYMFRQMMRGGARVA